MPEYEYVVKEEKIKEVVVTTRRYRMRIPVGDVPFSRKSEIEKHLNALFDMSVKLKLAILESLEIQLQQMRRLKDRGIY